MMNPASPVRRAPAPPRGLRRLAVRGWLVAPLLGLYPTFLMKVLCFALFACAFNLLLGFAGLLSFGHAAFLRQARPTSPAGWCARSGADARAGILAAAVRRALLGLLFGWLAIRRQGIYFAMITLALAQMVYFFCLQAPFTGGEDGMQGVPRGTCSA
jgi:branched-chain amino acid transport system permease protein